ncbi:methyltransferase, TIGR04325 family [Pigmentibacter sp. JX0631]|uniref:methyltransferase, TIGR04325 family n=1 Tax=Pigmentibacter sp. JX0631 TaxID=2976982 RepID=UPI0024689220|nr:methyltransferase, TIGR04325 family [Pigmentibacter sp. JX0631]WGL60832.1 methyltransferase, TIGR04325 family [Pigmentibacter sp. JX0631]
MFIKKLIKNVMPIGLYILSNKIKYLIYQLRTSNGYKGKYNSFSDAINFNNKYIDGFKSEEYNKNILKKTKNIENNIKSLTPVVNINDFILSMEIILHISQGNKILDIGGSIGHHYLNIKSTINDLDFYKSSEPKYFIMENKNLLNSINSYFFNEKFIGITEHPIKADLVIMSSTLHYIEDWKSLIKTLIDLGTKKFVLSRVPVHSGNTFISFQVIEEGGFPCYFFNEKDIIDFFSENQFYLKKKWACPENHAVYFGPAKNDSKYGYGFIFQK